MRKVTYLIAILIVFSNCANKKEKKAIVTVNSEKEAINTVLNFWHKNATEANFENYFNSMSDKSIFIGTDASENWSLQEFKDFSKPFFDQGKAWDFTALERNIYVYRNGELAWFDELLDTWMGVCRGSGVVIKNEGNWEIEHYVLSLTIPNDNIQDVKAINKEKDSIFLNRLK